MALGIVFLRVEFEAAPMDAFEVIDELSVSVELVIELVPAAGFALSKAPFIAVVFPPPPVFCPSFLVSMFWWKTWGSCTNYMPSV